MAEFAGRLTWLHRRSPPRTVPASIADINGPGQRRTRASPSGRRDGRRRQATTPVATVASSDRERCPTGSARGRPSATGWFGVLVPESIWAAVVGRPPLPELRPTVEMADLRPATRSGGGTIRGRHDRGRHDRGRTSERAASGGFGIPCGASGPVPLSADSSTTGPDRAGNSWKSAGNQGGNEGEISGTGWCRALLSPQPRRSSMPGAAGGLQISGDVSTLGPWPRPRRRRRQSRCRVLWRCCRLPP